jgi:hypothetical protein
MSRSGLNSDVKRGNHPAAHRFPGPRTLPVVKAHFDGLEAMEAVHTSSVHPGFVPVTTPA